jgi:hypothetical protein
MGSKDRHELTPVDSPRLVLGTIPSVSPYWVGLALSIALTVVGLFFMWKGKGTAWAANDFKFKGLSIGKLSAAGFVALLGFAGGAGCIYKLASAESSTELVHVAHVTGVENAPKLPDLASMGSEGERQRAIGQWLVDWYDNAEIEVDEGSSRGLGPGDYFATIATDKRARKLPQSEIANLQDSATSLLKVVRVAPHSSICQLQEFAYNKYFAAHPNATTLVPVREAVVAVPPREIDLRDEIVAAEDHKRWSEVIPLTDQFLLRHPKGFFSADVLFKKGYAQYQLGQYAPSAGTFRQFLDLYPFHASAPGARDWEEKASTKSGTG